MKRRNHLCRSVDPDPGVLELLQVGLHVVLQSHAGPIEGEAPDEQDEEEKVWEQGGEVDDLERGLVISNVHYLLAIVPFVCKFRQKL